MKSKILNLCYKYEYFVGVYKINNDKCVTIFPDRLFGRPKFNNEELIHVLQKRDNDYVVIRHGSKDTTQYILNKNVVRPLIIHDIFMSCHLLGLDFSLCRAYDETREEQNKLIKVIPGPEDVNDAIEDKIIDLYNNSKAGKPYRDEAIKLGIMEDIVTLDTFVKGRIEEYFEQ